GIAMICTFGDLTDVTWWRELQLPTRAIVGIDGRILPDGPPEVDAAAYSRVAGKTVHSAREEVVAMLRDSGDMEGDPKPITHPVKFYERDDKPITPDESALPVDPSSDPPPGYEESQRGKPGGFIGDPDVMDTWATSSLSPQIAGGWTFDDDLFGRVFPMDLRPQGQDIIRT